MAELRNMVFVRHLRSDASAHVLHHSGGRLKRSGKGLSFWFLPLSASIAEVPTDDRELPLLVHARSSSTRSTVVRAAGWPPDIRRGTACGPRRRASAWWR